VSGSIPPNGVVRFNLSHAQAMVLAAHLIDCLEQDGQDTAEVPLPYDYGLKFAQIIANGLGIPPTIAAEGLGVQG
jgi:hypothetical protein